jgi:hypothetical protein
MEEWVPRLLRWRKPTEQIRCSRDACEDSVIELEKYAQDAGIYMTMKE